MFLFYVLVVFGMEGSLVFVDFFRLGHFPRLVFVQGPVIDVLDISDHENVSSDHELAVSCQPRPGRQKRCCTASDCNHSSRNSLREVLTPSALTSESNAAHYGSGGSKIAHPRIHT